METRVGRSALWAAWGDAIGFVTERVSPSMLRKRIGSIRMTGPAPWTRRVGGKFGVEMPLPAGAYSDDTQLRLATSRAISTAGFDAEAFAKVELPVWPSYALGGGRASKAAAANLAKPTVPWFGNFFEGYFSSGGNGVAMRIQPHVWAAPTGAEPALVDVLHNGIITHGHPRALVGAVLHVLALHEALRTGDAPRSDRWPDLLDQTRRSLNAIETSETLAAVWQPVWERETGESLAHAWESTVDECEEMLHQAAAATEAMAAAGHDRGQAAGAYADIAKIMGLQEPATTGSGTGTVCASLTLVAAFPEAPAEACLLAANALDTDTDTIATMVGAVLGAVATEAPVGPLQDATYLEEEATRLAAVAAGRDSTRFNYPDLLAYAPPRSQVEAVGLVGDQMAISGLGFLQPDPEVSPARSKDVAWMWTVSDYGQSLLVKTRSDLQQLQESRRPPMRRYLGEPAVRGMEEEQLPNPTGVDVGRRGPGQREAGHRDLPALDGSIGREPVVRVRDQSGERSGRKAFAGDLNVDDVLRWVRSREYDDQAVGYALRRLAESGTLEQVVAFATAIKYAPERGRGR